MIMPTDAWLPASAGRMCEAAEAGSHSESRLERRPERHLQPPCALADAEDLAEVRVRQIGDRTSQTRAIEQVDDVQPELQVLVVHTEALEESEILGVQGRAADVEDCRRRADPARKALG